MKTISADSHVVEGPDVFTGLADRFGDAAPRVMDLEDQVDAELARPHVRTDHAVDTVACTDRGEQPAEWRYWSWHS